MENTTTQILFKSIHLDKDAISMDAPAIWEAEQESKFSVLLGQEAKVLYSAYDKQANSGMLVGIQKNALAEQELEVYFQSQRTALIQLAAGYKEFGIATREQEGHLFNCLVYESNGLANQVFTVLFMAEYGEDVLYGSFYGKFEDRQLVNSVALNCIQSVRFM